MTPLENASLGIIGGADGPTAVFVTGNPIPLVIIGFIAAAVIALLVMKRR